jgi:hypothetical protein
MLKVQAGCIKCVLTGVVITGTFFFVICCEGIASYRF